MDGGAHISRCMDRVGAVADRAVSISGGVDGVGTIVDGGMAHAWAHAFAAADVTSSFAHLPDCSPLA